MSIGQPAALFGEHGFQFTNWRGWPQPGSKRFKIFEAVQALDRLGQALSLRAHARF
jgi:hypothetical protein